MSTGPLQHAQGLHRSKPDVVPALRQGSGHELPPILSPDAVSNLQLLTKENLVFSSEVSLGNKSLLC